MRLPARARRRGAFPPESEALAKKSQRSPSTASLFTGCWPQPRQSRWRCSRWAVEGRCVGCGEAFPVKLASFRRHRTLTEEGAQFRHRPRLHAACRGRSVRDSQPREQARIGATGGPAGSQSGFGLADTNCADPGESKPDGRQHRNPRDYTACSLATRAATRGGIARRFPGEVAIHGVRGFGCALAERSARPSMQQAVYGRSTQFTSVRR